MITVNGTPIGEEAVAREMQYHPAPTLEQARDTAARALVVRELLRQRAGTLGIVAADEEEAVATLLAQEVAVPTPDEESCHRFYQANRDRYRAADLFEAAHILLPARALDRDQREAARRQAQDLIRTLLADPGCFAALAKAHSACPSRDNGGHLGQIGRGDTNPEFESFLLSVEPGLCPVPVPSRHGYHVLRLDRRVLGAVQPFALVRDVIARHLTARSRHQALAQYVSLLVGAARIDGISLDGADSPLVQ